MRTALELDLRPTPRHVTGRPWDVRELALLGKLPDVEVAARLGRTRSSVRSKRSKLQIPPAR